MCLCAAFFPFLGERNPHSLTGKLGSWCLDGTGSLFKHSGGARGPFQQVLNRWIRARVSCFLRDLSLPLKKKRRYVLFGICEATPGV